MKLTPKIPTFGNPSYRGKCPTERSEQVTCFNWLRAQYPNSWGILAFHPKLDGKKGYSQINSEKMEGVKSGVPDIVIPAKVTGLFEIKRKDVTQSKWQPNQQPYLLAAQGQGAFVCVCLGHEAFMEAVRSWQDRQSFSGRTVPQMR